MMLKAFEFRTDGAVLSTIARAKQSYYHVTDTNERK
jgi:hypothetical protein